MFRFFLGCTLAFGAAVWVGDAMAVGPGDGATEEHSPFRLIVLDGRLSPGMTHTLLVAAEDDNGERPARPPRLTASEGAVTFRAETAPGVYAFGYDVPIDAGEIEFSIGVFGQRYTQRMRTEVAAASRLEVPKRIDGVVRGGEVSFFVEGDSLPRASALQVVVGEGRVTQVSENEGRLEVRILPEENPFPRHIIIGVRDGSRLDRPAWVDLRLRARPKLSYETEPGASGTFRVGERLYGPFEADDEGQLEGFVDQYPGENLMHAVFVDDLGNETRTDIPLATKSQAAVVAFPTGERVVGQRPPQVYLHAIRADGGLWNRTPPSCRTPAYDLQVLGVEKGTWVVPLPRVVRDAPQDIRLECQIGINATTAVRVPVAQGVPDRIRLRVWPTELRADFPEAEINVRVEDVLGERVDVTGLEVGATHGDVIMGSTSGVSAAGDYAGGNAVEAGVDLVSVTYTSPPSEGILSGVQLGWADIPEAGRATLYGRALDAQKRPLPDVEVRLDAGAGAESGISGPDGWVTAEVRLPSGPGPVTLSARAGAHQDSTLVLRGQVSSQRSPGTPDLRADQAITISPGRISGISVSVDPANLRASPGAVAYVRVRLEDRAGKAVVDVPVNLVASSGTVGALRPKSDGSFIAEYVPGAVETSRQVTLTAETESLHSTTTLTIEPRLLRVSLSAFVGGLTNFAAVAAPIAGFDVDVRVRNPLLGERLMLRLGGSRYGFSRTYALDGVRWGIDSVVYPVHLAALYRADRGPLGGWFGGGASLSLVELKAQTGGATVLDGLLLTGGPVLFAGTGYRLLGGEVFLTGRALWIRGVGKDVGFNGNIGGLAAGAGYRVLF